MIQIIDVELGKYYDLLPKSKLSIEETNPLVEQKGSVSLPFNLAYTPHNLEILDFPQRFDRNRKYIAERNVIIICGTYQRKSKLVITSVQVGSSISGTFLIDEGTLHSRMRDVTMESVFGTIVRNDFAGTLDERVYKWTEYMDYIMCGDAVDDFRVFPVCTAYRDSEVYCDFLNHQAVSTDKSNWRPTTRIASSDGMAYFRLTALEKRDAEFDGKTVYFPVGYGVTPFLKLNVVLRKLFEHFGFSLPLNVFDSDPDLSKIVILNNTVDTLLKGVLNYRDLVPTCTANEFLNSIRYKYGCEFFVKQDGIEIELIFWNDYLDKIGQNVSEKISRYPTISYERYKTVKLTSQRNIKINDYNLITNDYKSYQDFKKAYPTYTEVNFNTDVYFNPPGTYLVKSWMVFCEYDGNIPIYIGQNTYDYFDDDENLDYVEIDNPEEALTVIIVKMNDRWDSENEIYEWCLMPYIDKTRQMNSIIRYSDKTTNESKMATECPIIHCYAHGRQVRIEFTGSYPERVYFGTNGRFNNGGEVIGNLELVYGGEHGLFNRFWKKYDTMLRSSYIPVQTALNLDAFEIMKYDKTQLDLLQGQPMILENIKYELSDTGVKVMEVNYRTSRHYE